MPVEKAKDFKGSIGKLFAYMKQYHVAVAVVILCAIASTVFSVIGPDILGKATTELSNGLLAKIQGTGSIDFTKIGQILLFVLGLYLLSTLFSFVQGWLMTGVTQKVCYRMRRDISEKSTACQWHILKAVPTAKCCPASPTTWTHWDRA